MNDSNNTQENIMDNWRTGGIDIGDMRRLTGEFESRLGHSWVRGRLKHGDILVAIAHSGDCFHDYLLLNHSRVTRAGAKQLYLDPVPHSFGAYTLGEPMGRLGSKQLDLIMTGQDIMIDVPADMPELPVDPRIDELVTNHIRMQALSPVVDFNNETDGKRIYDWRSQVGKSVAAIWPLLPADIRLAIAADAEEKAMQEIAEAEDKAARDSRSYLQFVGGHASGRRQPLALTECRQSTRRSTDLHSSVLVTKAQQN